MLKTSRSETFSNISAFSNLWRAYEIIVEIHTQQNSPHGFRVMVVRLT